MVKIHSLLKKAFIYKGKRTLKDPDGCIYDNSIGAWLLEENNEFLVKSRFNDRPKPQTKKMDMETGEDYKSE